jgi:hypothetical protein
MTQRRLTVHEAARRLGISEDAVRMRVKRETLTSEREEGRLYVLLDEDPTTDPTDRTDELIEELRNRVGSLEDQLGQERRANDENRRLLLAALERIPPQIEAPTESPLRAEEAPGGSTPGEARAAPEAAGERPERQGERRPWWRRVFGG